MKHCSWIFVAVAMAPLVPLACGGETTSSSSSSTGSGGSGPTTTTSTGTTSTATGTGGGGGAVDCSGILTPGECATCGQASCCHEAASCNQDADCLECKSGTGDPTTCAANAALKAFDACISDSCASECTPTPSSVCNPVTGEGCNTANGDTCDLSGSATTSRFVCFPPPNDAVLCGACGDDGPFCAAGTNCFKDKCARFCCTDGDCGTGKCDTTVIGTDGIGVCVDAVNDMAPSCDAPATSPSMGSCYKGATTG